MEQIDPLGKFKVTQTENEKYGLFDKPKPPAVDYQQFVSSKEMALQLQLKKEILKNKKMAI